MHCISVMSVHVFTFHVCLYILFSLFVFYVLFVFPCVFCCVLALIGFYGASICEGGRGSRNSVCPSVCLSVIPSVTRVDCDKSKWCTVDILIPRKHNHCYSDTNSSWSAMPPSLWNLRSKWPTPFEKHRLRQISAYNVSTVRDSEKSSIMTNIKSTVGYPTSYGLSAYVTPTSRKGGSKSDFSFFE